MGMTFPEASPPRRHGCAIYAVVLAVVLLLFAGMAVAGVVWVMSLMRSSGGFDQAVALASADARVQQALGSPLEPGWLVGGQIRIVNEDGTSALSSSLTGTRGSGTLRMAATRHRGTWTLTMVTVATPGGEIDVLAASTGEPEGAPLPAEAPPSGF